MSDKRFNSYRMVLTTNHI